MWQSRACPEVEGDWLRRIRRPIPLRLQPRTLPRPKLRPRLLAVSDAVVGAEWNLFAARQQELLAALHHILLIERPRVHEVLQHDHEHPIRDCANVKSLGELTRRARGQEIAGRFGSSGYR